MGRVCRCAKLAELVAENPGAVRIEQPGCGMDERGRPLHPAPIDGGGNTMVLRAALPAAKKGGGGGGGGVRALLARYGIETAREYKMKSRQGLNALRSAGRAIP